MSDFLQQLQNLIEDWGADLDQKGLETFRDLSAGCKAIMINGIKLFF